MKDFSESFKSHWDTSLKAMMSMLVKAEGMFAQGLGVPQELIGNLIDNRIRPCPQRASRVRHRSSPIGNTQRCQDNSPSRSTGSLFWTRPTIENKMALRDLSMSCLI